MQSVSSPDPDYPEFVEVDPTGRYGRYNEILGKGASKTVYRAFDEYEGIEVAWNQVQLFDFLQSPEDLERLYCEIHLLKTLKHKNIMKFYTSWVDTSRRNINFITEMFTSGTLRQYRQKHKRVNIRAVKHWCKQILSGLLYLHSHDPPIIHRDLKCDNIFVNGNQGEVKIGDLGLAAILRKSHAVHCVGTPEFMAPEVYEEEYNELVDVYSFGMCVLEMITFEYPYSECTHPVQIYKKVTSGTKPEALYRIKDPEVRHFINKCLATASERLSAKELLKDPFLQADDSGSGSFEDQDICSMDDILQHPSLGHIQSNGSWIANSFTNSFHDETELDNGWGYDASDVEAHGMDLFNGHEDEHPPNMDITIKGRKREDGEIFLRLRIADKDGHVRNIYFQFDIEADTALSVATEMVAELDITDHEVTRIAEMIDGEVASLVPGWKPGPGIEEMPGVPNANFCEHCASNVSSYGSLLDFLSLKNPGHSNLQSLHCPHLEYAQVHGRFEEITYQVDGSEHFVTEGAPDISASQSDVDFNSQESGGNHSDEEGIQLDHLANDHKPTRIGSYITSNSIISLEKMSSTSNEPQHFDFEERSHCRRPSISNDYANVISQKVLKLNCQVDQQEYSGRHVGRSRSVLHPSADFGNGEFGIDDEVSGSSVFKAFQSSNGNIESFHIGTHSFRVPEIDLDATSTNSTCAADAMSGHYYGSHPNFQSQRGRNCEVNADGSSDMFPVPLTRAKSLPVMQ